MRVLVQAESGCEVLLHPDDIEMGDPSGWKDSDRELFGPLGFSDEEIAGMWGGEDSDFEWKAPQIVRRGSTYAIGRRRRLGSRMEHHPGHSPGHIWVVDEASGAIFVGDFVLGDHPTNAGMEHGPLASDRTGTVAPAVQRGLR